MNRGSRRDAASQLETRSAAKEGQSKCVDSNRTTPRDKFPSDCLTVRGQWCIANAPAICTRGQSRETDVWTKVHPREREQEGQTAAARSPPESQNSGIQIKTANDSALWASPLATHVAADQGDTAGLIPAACLSRGRRTPVRGTLALPPPRCGVVDVWSDGWCRKCVWSREGI